MNTTGKTTDFAILLRKGDEGAFEQLFNTYYPRLRHFASKYITDDLEAEDVVQDCFVRLYEQRKHIIHDSVSSLLFTMVRNQCLNYLKHQVLVHGFQHDELHRKYEAEQLYALDMKGSADEPLIIEELKAQLQRIMDQLPQRSQEIFYLSRQKGLKNKEIAEQLGISVKVVEKHISKVLAAFRENIRQNPDFDSITLILLYYLLLAG